MLPLVLADFDDPNDARMIQIGRCLGFQLKPAEVLCVGQLAGQDHLDGHEPLQAELAGLVDYAHAALAQSLQQ
jgi:hypothetical protein